MSSNSLPRAREPLESRESVLRASILESALELGVGTSRVTQWMFSPVEEDEEEEIDSETVSPSLTYASTATSSESSPLHSYQLHSRPQPGAAAGRPAGKPALAPTFSFPDGREGAASPTPEHLRAIHFDLAGSIPEQRTASPTPANTPKKKGSKLRKWRTANGNESEGGYLSDGGSSKEKKDKEKKKKKTRGDGDATEGESDGGYLSDMLSRRRKGAKKKDAAESPATDYETDSASRKRRGTLTSGGDESDGGNLSETVSKKRGLFSRSPRKNKRNVDPHQGQNVPPVPALPPMQQLPIAQRFLRADSFDTSRTATPNSLRSGGRGSEETWTSSERDADIRSITNSVNTADGLIGAFRDAQSVRTPSIDALSTFNMLGANAPPLSKSPLRPRLPPRSMDDTPDSSAMADVPTISVPNPSKRERPAPLEQTSFFSSGKHVPTPLHLSPSTSSLHSQVAQQFLHSPASEWSLVTTSGDSNPPASAKGALPPPSPTKRQQAIPPPTPPPRGPLPDVPSDVASTMDRLSMRPSFDDSLTKQPSISGRTPARSASDGDAVPTLAQLAMEEMRARSPSPTRSPQKIMRAREAPFPVSPIGSRAASPLPGRAVSPLPGQSQTSQMQQMKSSLAPPGAGRVPRFPVKAASADEYLSPRMPASADAYAGNSLRMQQQSYSRRPPHSANAMGMVPNVPTSVVVERESHLDMSDDEEVEDDAPQSRGEANMSYLEHDRSHYLEDADGRPLSEYPDDDQSHYPEDEERPYSMYSEAESRHSFMDPEKSANTRARFMKRVEAMYGEEVIPPVPYLSPHVHRGVV